MKIDHFKKSLMILLMLMGLLACSFNVDQGGNAGGSTGSKEKLVVTVTNVGESSVELRWNAIEGVARYVVQRSTSPNGEFYPIGFTEINNLKASQLLPTKKYYFRVRELIHYDPISFEGDIYGISSDVVEATTTTATLAAPIMKSISSTEYSVTIFWEPIPGVDHYNIYRMDVWGGDFVHAGASGGSYTDDKLLKNGKTYRYKVVAYNYNTGETSNLSNEATVTIKPATLVIPELAYNACSYEIDWLPFTLEPEETMAHYFFNNSTTDVSFYSGHGITSATELNSKEVQPGETYYYRFRIFNKTKGQSSSISKLYTITLPQPELAVKPDKLKLDDIYYHNTGNSYDYDTEVTISWQPVAGVDSYYIYKDDERPGVKFLGQVITPSFSYRFNGGVSEAELTEKLLVRAVNTTTKEAGPFSAPLWVKVK